MVQAPRSASSDRRKRALPEEPKEVNLRRSQGTKRAETFVSALVNIYRPSLSLSMSAMAMPAAIMSTSTMIPTMAVVVRIPMPIIAVAVVAGTEAEVNRRRFDHHNRLVIIDRWRGIIDRRSWRTIGCWPANNYARQGWQRQPQSEVESHSGLRSRNGSEENGREQN
jgi:hypothetical protein